MAKVRRSASCALFLTALVLATSACGTQHATALRAVLLDPKAVVDPLVAQTSIQVLQHATANTEAAAAVHVTGKAQDSGHTLTFNLSVAGNHGCTGKMTESNAGSFQLTSDGTTVWLKPDNEFWRVAAGVTDSATLARVEGKWLTAMSGGSGLGAVAQLCQLKTLLKGFSPSSSTDPRGEVKGPITIMNHQRVLKVSDTADSAFVYVTDTAQPKMLQVIDPTSGGGTFSFDYPGTPATISPPPPGEILNTGQ